MAQFTVGTEHAEPTISTANATPLALCAFAFPTVILGSIFAGFIVPSVGTAMSLLAAVAFFGGLVQMLAGMWDMRQGEMLNGTIFVSYGWFLMALGVMVAPSLGIFSALSTMIHPALGLFFLAWTIFSAILFLSSLRTNTVTIITLALLFLSFLFLTIGELAGGSTALLIIGGWLAIITGLVAWYHAFASLLHADKSVFHLPA